MIQPLSMYGFQEVEYLKPSKHNYNVTISSNDHIITIEENGDLLATLGLKIENQILYLIGKDGEPFASAPLPQAQYVENVKYENNVITFTIRKIDGETEPYTINVADLVDIYQSGDGIEISEGKDGKKTINIKINDDSSDVLSADEDGLAIDLDKYAKKCCLKSLDDELHDEITRSTDADSKHEYSIQWLKSHKVEKEDGKGLSSNDFTDEYKDKIDNFPSIDNLATKDELNKKVDKDSLPEGTIATQEWVDEQGYLTEHQSLDAYATKDELKEKVDKEYGKELSSNDFSNEYKAKLESLPSVDELSTKFVSWDKRGERKHIVLDNHDNILGVGTDGGEFNLAMISKWNVADFGSNAIHMNLNTNDSVTINDVEKVATQEWVGQQGYITNSTLEDYATKDELNGKVDKEEGKSLSSNDFTDEYKAKIENLPEDEIATQEWVNEQGYLTEHQSLEDYCTKSECDEKYATKDELNGKVDVEDGKGLSSNDFTDSDKEKVNKIPESEIATQEWVNEQGYLTEHQSLEGYYTKSECDEKYATSAELDGKVDVEDGKGLSSNDFTDNYKAMLDEIPEGKKIATRNWVEKQGYLTEHQSLEDYYTKDECDGKYALKGDVDDKITQTDAENIFAAQFALESDKFELKENLLTDINESLNSAKTEAFQDATAYTDSSFLSYDPIVNTKINAAIDPLSKELTKDTAILSNLTSCVDYNPETRTSKYDVARAMQDSSTSPFDELYRLVHNLLKEFDENDLSKLNEALHKLI